MKRSTKSTYDRITQDKKRKANIDREYQEILISELLIAAIKDDVVSVRELAKEAGVSPTIIQELKIKKGVHSGTKQNITLQSFLKILQALDCSLFVKKNKHTYPIVLGQS